MEERGSEGWRDGGTKRGKEGRREGTRAKPGNQLVHYKTMAVACPPCGMRFFLFQSRSVLS